MDKINIIWHGHSCFTLEYQGYLLVLDPYAPSVPGYRPIRLTANKVLCSHSHGDHSYLEGVAMPLNDVPCPFGITDIPSFHDERQGALRGQNIIRVISAGSLRVVHLGDLGHIPTPEQVRLIGRADALLIPVGGTYTITPAQAVQVCTLLDPAVTIPMHYRRGECGYSNIANIDEFTSLCKNAVMYDSNTFTLTPGMQKQTAVLKYIG